MSFVSCPDRDRILTATGHVVVTGGPGSGKTTVALRKALVRISTGLQPGQKILFLSFSRAAVARIVEAAREGVPRESRQHLETHTFHSFCWQIVRGHGYLLGAPNAIRLLPPHDERTRRNGAKDADAAWDAERERLFLEDGLLAFDLFASKTLALLQGSRALRRLVANRYPMIVVDEAQDTGTDQWACLETLAECVELVCLADLDQQIYDFRSDVSPGRLTQIIDSLKPMAVDLGVQNNRSPGVEIVTFGNDILASTPRGAQYVGVTQMSFAPLAANRNTSIRSAVGIACRRIQETSGHPPESIGYLTNWGRGVTTIARALQGGDGVKEIPHRVVMDEAEVLLATRIIALCLEPIEDSWATLDIGLGLTSALYRSRGGVSNITKAEQLSRNATDARERRLRGNAKCPKGLNDILLHLQSHPLTGNPAHDWLLIRQLFKNSRVRELEWVAGLVIYLMGFNRGRRIADALAEVWRRTGRYEGARGLVEAEITEDQIVGSDGGLSGVNVMTMHKSKGKEFDGVIILHLGNNMSPLSRTDEPAPHAKSRRLLRVAVTRARHGVLMLTDASSPSPILEGHRL